MTGKRVYYIRGRYLNNRTVEDIDRAEGKKELHYFLREYAKAFGPGWSFWVTDSHGKRLDEEEI